MDVATVPGGSALERQVSDLDAVAKAHARLIKDGAFQFDRSTLEMPKIPPWLAWIGDLLEAIAPFLKWIFWGGLAVLAALILYAIVREILKLRAPAARATPHVLPAAELWRPDAAAARNLLDEADRLAAQGLYGEAAHLLLLRSVEDIQTHRARAVGVALTTREIAGLAALPDAARAAFSKIGAVVERSLFGGGAVNADAFADCRQAYEAFALPSGWRA